MKAAARFVPATLILAGFFLIRTYLYRLPIAEAFHGSNLRSFVDVGDDASTEISQSVELAPTSTLNEGCFQATTTTQGRASATEATTASSSSSLDQIVVMGTTNSEDTSWVEKLPLSVIRFWFSCDKC